MTSDVVVDPMPPMPPMPKSTRPRRR
jgi:hypothetical protein